MLLLLTAAALLMAFTVCAPAEETVTLPRLVKTVTEYGLDYETQTRVPLRTWNFTYENGYPVSVDQYEIDADMHLITTFSYVFEEGLPTERKTFDSEGVLLSVTEYRSGCVYGVREQSDFQSGTLFYQYGNTDGYFTLLLQDHRSQDPSGSGNHFENAEEVDAVSVTVQNGLLLKTVNTGMYANWSDKEAKEWMRFNGTYTADYDEDGIVALTSAEYREGQSGVQGRYEVTKAAGSVTEGTCYTSGLEGTWQVSSWFTFEYTEIETTPARYAQMINSFLMGSGNSYYNYNWY